LSLGVVEGRSCKTKHATVASMSPVAMNFKPQNASGGLHSSPANRAAMDEARVRAKMERLNRTPGPGSYDARLPVGSVGNAGAAAFKSSTKRSKESDLNYMGDPGAYDAYAGAELASTAGKSFGKSTQSGQGGFGSTAQARQPLAQASEAPGPGSYDAAASINKPDGKESSAFKSKTNRGAYTKASVAPGVGSYDPVLRTDTVLGGQSAFKSAEQRFKKDVALEAQAHVGPGSYTNTQNTISNKIAPEAGKVSSAFASTTLRDGFLGL